VIIGLFTQLYVFDFAQSDQSVEQLINGNNVAAASIWGGIDRIRLGKADLAGDRGSRRN